MGVQGLWAQLSPSATDTTLAQLALQSFRSNSNALRGIRLGIDASLWLFHSQSGQGGSNPQLRTLFYRLARLLSLPILPLFVFDGASRPSFKRGRHVAGVTHPIQRPFVALIHAFGFCSHQAPGEAEAELAWLNSHDLIDAVMTDDVDALLFGAKLVIRNWGSRLVGSQARAKQVASAVEDDERDGGHTVDSDEDRGKQRGSAEEASSSLAPSVTAAGKVGDSLVTVYRSWDIENMPELCVPKEGLILVALLSGGDYDMGGLLPRCGVKIAFALAQAGYGEELVSGFLRLYTQETLDQTLADWSDLVRAWSARVKDELRTNRNGFLTTRRPNLANSFPSEPFVDPAARRVIASYVWPVTTSDTNAAAPLEFRWSNSPDLGSMARQASQRFEWNPTTVLARFRNLIWPGVAVRQLMRISLEVEGQDDGLGPWGELVESPASRAVARARAEGRGRGRGGGVGNTHARRARPTREKPLHDSPNATRITDFFSRLSSKAAEERGDDDYGRKTTVDANRDASGDASRDASRDARFLSIRGQRRHATMGGQLEYRVEIDPTNYLHQARLGFVVVDDDLDPRSGSPSGSDPVEEGDATPIRIWLPACMMETDPIQSRPLVSLYLGKQKEKAEGKAKGRRTKVHHPHADTERQRTTLDGFVTCRSKPTVAAAKPRTTSEPAARAAPAPSTQLEDQPEVWLLADSSVEEVYPGPPPPKPGKGRGERKIDSVNGERRMAETSSKGQASGTTMTTKTTAKARVGSKDSPHDQPGPMPKQKGSLAAIDQRLPSSRALAEFQGGSSSEEEPELEPVPNPPFFLGGRARPGRQEGGPKSLTGARGEQGGNRRISVIVIDDDDA
ncbi:hypothetical protein IE53DRAFT_262463 [Violaceomyces palustris]|uniref:Uncharacterized protein n=1 Tax=Violaceomyces palustris TaxID=1673888 RepID=A0ACD0NN21_9BASI|nr:hypothetical protein IE53DRAFT_262463 [Violaceomyces palustris]